MDRSRFGQSLKKFGLFGWLMVGLVLPNLGEAATLSFDGFESPAYAAGPLGSQGGWVSASISGSSVINVTGSQAYEGGQSVYVFDGDTTNRPKVRYDYGTTSAAGDFVFSVKEDAGTSARDLWRVDFFNAASGTTNFTISLGSGTSMSLAGGANGSTTLATVNPTTTSYNPAGWNTFRISFNNTTKTASVYLNGSSSALFSSSDTATNWSAGRVELSVAFGSATGQGVYYDSFNSEWQTTNRLKYAPPTLVAPTVVTLAQGGYFEPHYGNDEDVIIHFPHLRRAHGESKYLWRTKSADHWRRPGQQADVLLRGAFAKAPSSKASRSARRADCRW